MTTDNKRNKLKLNRERIEGGVEERLHKVLANAGLGSRRALEERIEAGEVRVNGAVAELGSSIRSSDRVEMDGKAFVAVPIEADDTQILMYHKPEGELTTNDDPEGRNTIFERLPRLKEGRWIAVGRLDMNTTGILLVTNDGEIANKLMHPSSEIEREYICRVSGAVNEETLEQLRRGIQLEDGPANFDDVGIISIGESHSWIRVVLSEGRNREVRRMWDAVNHAVSRLKRIRYGKIELPRNLRRGHTQALTPEQVAEMRSDLGLPATPQSLTLEPVIGVRRAAKTTNEFRPTESNRGYSGTSDEARELRAFDRVRDDTLGQRPRRGRPAGPGRGAPRSGAPRTGAPRAGAGAGRGRGEFADARPRRSAAGAPFARAERPSGEPKPRFARADALPGTGPARGPRGPRDGARADSRGNELRRNADGRPPRRERGEFGNDARPPRGDRPMREGYAADNRGPRGPRNPNFDRGTQRDSGRDTARGPSRGYGNERGDRVGGGTVFADGSTFNPHGGNRHGNSADRNRSASEGNFRGPRSDGPRPAGARPAGARPSGPRPSGPRPSGPPRGGNFRGGPRGGGNR